MVSEHNQTEDLYIQIGRVVFINFGPSTGRIAVVIDIINDNSILVEGPTSGVERSIVPLKRVEVTKFLIPAVLRNMRSSLVKKHCEAFKLNERWATTEKAKRHARQLRRAQLTDFDRFKVVTLRRKLGSTLRKWVNDKRKTLVKADAKKK